MASKRGFNIGASADDTCLLCVLMVKIVWFQEARGCFFYYVGGRQPLDSFIFLRYLAQNMSCFISLVTHGIQLVYWPLGFRAFL